MRLILDLTRTWKEHTIKTAGENGIWEPNTFFEDLLHPLVRKVILHLKEAILHLQ